jgi:ribosome-binding protein aMBF1 (putative translation factor)
MTEREYRTAIRKDGKEKTHQRTTDFPEWLRIEIMKLGISQRQLANELDICESIISRWLNGNRFPTVKQVLTLSDFMKVSTDTIMAKK